MIKVWEPKLEIEKIEGSEERAQKCAYQRDFSNRLLRKHRKEEHKNLICDILEQILFGVFMFGIIGVALYLGA